VSSLIQDLNIKNAGKVARRVTKRYATSLQSELNNDPNLQAEEDWRNIIYKESGYALPPQEGYQSPTIRPIPQGQGKAPSIFAPPAQAQFYPQSPAFNPQSPTPSPNNAQGVLTRQELIRILEERDERKREESEKSAILDTLGAIKDGMNNLNQRVSALENRPMIGMPEGEGGRT